MIRRIHLLSLVVAGFLLVPRQAAASCAAPANPIEAENCLPGNPTTDWDTQSPVYRLAGFTDSISYLPGQTVGFRINSDLATSVRLDVFRMGWYGGKGARKVGSLTVPGIKQPACLFQSQTELMDCGNWPETANWPIPANSVSGIYIVKMTGNNGDENQMVFVVRNDTSHSDILLMTVDTTWQAYNHWLGYSLYKPPNSRAYKVSYNRPFIIRLQHGDTANSAVFDHEFTLLTWLEKNGYDVTYTAHADLDRNGALIKNHRIFMASGHDEYTSINERNAIQSARDAGINMAFMTANEVSWKTRWEPSVDGRNTPYRTLVTYKEATNRPSDPKDPPIWTGLWTLPPKTWTVDVQSRGLPSNELSGTTSCVGPQPVQNWPLHVTAADGKMRFWRNTAAANLPPGGSIDYPQLIGYEWDCDFDNGFRNLASWRTSDSFITFDPQQGLQARHNLMMYKHINGALVWGTGTMQWSWGLNAYHNQGSHLPPQHDIEQATVNILADMGVQPVTLEPGLVPATASTDVTPPVCTVTSPPFATAGTTVTATGTARDFGGGVVGGVIVSFDSGNTWFRADGRDNWSLTLYLRNGGGTVKCRAVDDSGNLEGRFPTPPQPPQTIFNPAPGLNFLNPRAVRPGSPTLNLFVHGSGFVNGSTILWNGQSRATTYVDPLRLLTSVSSSELANEMTARVNVFTPGPGGGTSRDLQFVVSESAVLDGLARVYPSPWNARDNLAPQITFDSVQNDSDIKLFTLSSHWVRTLHTDLNGVAVWDLKNDAGENVASGYYLYLLTDIDGNKVRGKLAVIR